MAVALPDEIYIYICTVAPDPPVYSFPTGCELRGPFKSSVLQEDQNGPTKEQYDAMFGAVLMIVAMVIAFALIKKAIEQ